VAGKIKQIGEKKFNHLIGTRSRDLLACRVVPKPATLHRAPPHLRNLNNNTFLQNLLYFAMGEDPHFGTGPTKQYFNSLYG
jgi:hypothetical protein